MKKILLALLTSYCFLPTVSAQQPYENNGKLDDFSELSSVITLPMEMPDGVKLMTDIYLPVTQDCLMVQIATEPIFGMDPLPIEFIRSWNSKCQPLQTSHDLAAYPLQQGRWR